MISVIERGKHLFFMISSTAIWDYFYLCAFAINTFLLPLFIKQRSQKSAVENSFILEDKFEEDFKFIPFALSWILYLMGYCLCTPIVGAIFFQIYFFGFLKEILCHKDARKWVSRMLW